MPKKPCILNRSAVKRLFADAGIPKIDDETIDIMGTNITSIFRVIARIVPLRQRFRDTLDAAGEPVAIVTPEEASYDANIGHFKEVSAAVPVATMMNVPGEPPAADEVLVIDHPMQERVVIPPAPDPIPAPPTPEKKVAVATAPREPAYTKPTVAPGDVACEVCFMAVHGTSGDLYCRNELSESYRTRVGKGQTVVGCSLGEPLTDDNLSGDSDDDGTTPPTTV